MYRTCSRCGLHDACHRCFWHGFCLLQTRIYELPYVELGLISNHLSKPVKQYSFNFLSTDLPHDNLARANLSTAGQSCLNWVLPDKCSFAASSSFCLSFSCACRARRMEQSEARHYVLLHTHTPGKWETHTQQRPLRATHHMRGTQHAPHGRVPAPPALGSRCPAPCAPKAHPYALPSRSAACTSCGDTTQASSRGRPGAIRAPQQQACTGQLRPLCVRASWPAKKMLLGA